MSVSYFVRYDIAVPDLPEFLERYRRAHVPMVSKWPGLRRMVLHTPLDWQDFKRFMTFEGTVTHQAMASEEVWRRLK
jgi:hypothetical protein